MLPAVGTCRGCRLRQREIHLLQQALEKREKDCVRLERRCARLKKANRRLRQELDETHRKKRRQAHPFRRAQGKQTCKKPGRPPGHQADLRPTPPPETIDRVLNVPIRLCPECHVELVDPKIHVQYQTDLPPIVPLVTQFNIESGWCPCCQRRWQGRHPEQTSNATGAAGNTLGPGVLTMAAELKHRLGVPYRKICDFLKTYCGLYAAPATFVRAEQRLAELAQPTFNLLLDALRRAQVVHADETGWRVGRQNAWLWVFSNKEVTVYAIRTGKGARGHQVPEDILGNDFDGFLIIDGFKAYDVLHYAKGQCNGHLLRRAKEMGDTAEPREQQKLQTLIRLIQEGIDLAERRDQLSVAGYARRASNIENRFDAWLTNAARSQRSAEFDRLVSHIANHYDEWLLFLREPLVPPTNNHAERMVRPAVPIRKIGGCNKTLRGALVHSILSSLMVTWHQRGHQFINLARQLWASAEPPAIPLPPLPQMDSEPPQQKTKVNSV
jgi:transposase